MLNKIRILYMMLFHPRLYRQKMRNRKWQKYLEMRNRELQEELAGRDQLLPPWRKYPQIQRYSIGWRMGYGEIYLEIWHIWAGTLGYDGMLSYFKDYAPIPLPWIDWVVNTLGWKSGLGSEIDRYDEGVRKLEALEICENYAAWKRWFEEHRPGASQVGIQNDDSS